MRILDFSFSYRKFLLIILTLSAVGLRAQNGFTIIESLKNSKSENFTFEGTSNSAYLTSGKDDPEGDGWLRLTSDKIWQTGYAVLNQSFPSGLGVLVDLEFMTWRSVQDPYGGADGFSVFLFDATASPFNIGAFGGSLGYAQYDRAGIIRPGVSAGYMGLGIDEYGNYSNPNEGRIEGPGFKKNTIGLRGPASENYRWITGNTNLGFSLQYGQSNARPSENQYYRRVQVEIKPVSNAAGSHYIVTARIKTSKSGKFVTVFGPSPLTTSPPALLKLGLAASTGSAVNFHEVRNLIVTTPDGVGIRKSVNKSIAKVGSELIYNIDLYNQTDTVAKGLILTDVLPANFQTESVTFEDNGNTQNTASGYTQTNVSQVTVGLDAYSHARLVVKGKVTGMPANNTLTNTATFNVGSSGIIDPDLFNNTSTVSTQIISTNEKISLVKSVANSKQFKLGEEIRYRFIVENPGEIALSNVNLTDNKLITAPVYVSGDVNSNSILEPGESWIYSGGFVVRQADLDSGRIINQAIVTSTDPVGDVVKDNSGATASDNLPTITPIDQLAKVTLVKTRTSTGPYHLGSIIRYSFAVNNTGNTSLTQVTLTDNKLLTAPVLQSGDLNANGKLDVGETWYYTSEYELTQADIDAKSVTNSALVKATDPLGNPVTDISGNTVEDDYPTVTPIDQTGKIALVKVISNTGPFKSGDEIRYAFTVINTGNAPLSQIKVTDPKLTSPVVYSSGDVNNNGFLDTNESWLYTGRYVVTQVDVDSGKVVNSAVVSAKGPSSNPVEDVSGPTALEDTPTITLLPQTARLAMIKAVNNTGVFRRGDVIKYDFTVANTGNVTLSNVVLKDSLLSDVTTLISKGNGDNLFDVGEIWVYRGGYTVTQADVDSGRVTNTATITASDPQGRPVKDISGSTTINDQTTVSPIAQSGKIALLKSVTSSGRYTLGSTVTYAFSVINTGTVTLSGVALTDSKLTAGPVYLSGDANGNSKLDVAESWIYTGSHQVTQSDMDAGFVVNSCTVSAVDPQGDKVSDVSGSAINNDFPTTTLVHQVAGIALVKQVAGAGPFRIGNGIDYTFMVANTGTVTLTQSVITDLKLNFVPIYQQGDVNENGKLDVGEIWTYGGRYVVTGADVNNGSVTNTAIVTATDPQGNVVKDISGATVNDDIPTVTPVIQAPSANPDEATTKMDIAVTIDVLDNDREGGAALNRDSVQVISQPLHGQLTLNPDGTITYTPEDGYTGTDSFTYKVQDTNGKWSNVTVVGITVLPNKLFIPNVFTPNADGKNDSFEIPGMDSYSGADLRVFNRWGNEVFHSSSYHNEWDGKGLNEGTYYYVLKLKKSEKEIVYKGWVLLKR